MRRLIPFLLLFAAFPAFAADTDAQPMPKDLQPLPAPPAPPPGFEPSPDLEPEVTITSQGGNKVEEYRVGGKLYMKKITPPHGVPYYLVDQVGNGQFSRQDNLDSGIRVPQWVLIKF